MLFLLRSLIVCGLFLLFGSAATADENGNTLRRITTLIEADFAGEDRFSLLNIERIQAIKSLHDQTQRLGEDQSRLDLVDIKFMYSNWYLQKCELIKALLNRTDINEVLLSQAITALDILRPFIAAGELDYALAKGAPPDLLQKLERVIRESSLPASTRKLRAYESNRRYAGLPTEWPEDIQNFPYELHSDGSVTHRGIRFRSGDKFSADLALPHEGALDSFSGEPPLYTHSGTFVNYQEEAGGPQFPAVIEIHKKGRRLVPLAVWLSPQFVYLARVLRVPAIESDISLALSEVYRKIPHISYDWQGRNPVEGGGFPEDRRCATCTSLGANLLSQLNITYPMPHSVFLDEAVENLALLGMGHVRGFFSPSSLSFASGLESIGTVDNSLFRPNLSRYLIIGYPGIEGSLGSIMSTKRLNPAKLPTRYTMTVAEIWAAQQKNIVGTIARGLGGFKQAQMPDSTTPQIIAFYLVSNNALSQASTSLADNCGEVMAMMKQRTPLRISEHFNSPPMKKSIIERQAAGGLPSWFD